MAARWPEIERQPSGTPLQVWFPGPRGCTRGARACGSLQARGQTCPPSATGTTAKATSCSLTHSTNIPCPFFVPGGS